MNDGISIGFVDFTAVLLDSDRVRCVSARSFLVRNWSGGCQGPIATCGEIAARSLLVLAASLSAYYFTIGDQLTYESTAR